MSLIGNTQGFALDLAPVSPDWDTRYGPERAGWAGLSIWAGGENLCRHLAPGSTEVQERLFVPLGPVADWLVRVLPALAFEERAAVFPTSSDMFQSLRRWGAAPPALTLDADSWFELREEWWERHFLTAGSDGAYLPNVALVRDDEHLVVTWAPPRFVASDAPVLLTESGNVAIPWDEGEKVIGTFVRTVGTSFRNAGAEQTFSWATEGDPLRRPTVVAEALQFLTARSVSSLEVLFGVEGLDEVLLRLGLGEGTADPAESPGCQVLRDISPHPQPSLGDLLQELGDRATSSSPIQSQNWLKARELARDAARAGESPEEAGQEAATHLRRALGVNGQPISELTQTLGQLGLGYEHDDAVGGYDRMMVGGRVTGTCHAMTMTTSRTEHWWSRRFEAARALGHATLDPIRAGALGAASGPFAQASRRRRSGAFAAEFLLPDVAIDEASGGRLDGAANDDVFEPLLERFGIGARAAAYQLWNKGWISSPEIRDELVDKFAA